MKKLALQILPPLVLLLLWELCADYGLVNRFLMPAPSAIFVSLSELLKSGELVTDILQSIKRVGVGFAVAVFVGVPIGLAVGLSARMNLLLAPLVQFFRPISPIAWIPLAILWFGIGDGPSFFLTMIAALFPIILNTHFGVRSISAQHMRVARCFEAPFPLVFRRVIWPATLPYVISGCRIGLGIAWMSVVGAEMIAAHSGLGYLIHINQDLLRTDRVIGGMIVIGLIGLSFDYLMRILDRRMTHWMRAGT